MDTKGAPLSLCFWHVDGIKNGELWDISSRTDSLNFEEIIVENVYPLVFFPMEGDFKKRIDSMSYIDADCLND